MTQLPPDADPPPVPPTEPRMAECCRGGCNPCIFDLYEEELARYRIAREAWEARQNKN